MKYALMSAILRSELKSTTPYFGDVLRAQELGFVPPPALTADELYAFLDAHGVHVPHGTMSFEDFVVYAKSKGYQGVDMMSQLLELPGQTVHGILEKHGMKLACINVVPGFCTAESEADMDRKLQDVFMNIDKAADAGAEYLLVMPAYTALAPGITRETGYQLMLLGMRESVKYASRRNLQITTETLQFINTPYGSTGEILRILHDIPELTFTLDTGNCLPMQEDPVEMIDAVKDRIIGVHVKDIDFTDDAPTYRCIDGRGMKMVPYGHGLVDYPALYQKLEKIGFDGWIAFEGVSRNPDPKKGLVEDLAWFQALSKNQ